MAQPSYNTEIIFPSCAQEVKLLMVRKKSIKLNLSLVADKQRLYLTYMPFGCLRKVDVSINGERDNFIDNWTQGRTIPDLIREVISNNSLDAHIIEKFCLYCWLCSLSAYSASLEEFVEDVDNIMIGMGRYYDQTDELPVKNLIILTGEAYHIAWKRNIIMVRMNFMYFTLWTPNECTLIELYQLKKMMRPFTLDAINRLAHVTRRYGRVPIPMFNKGNIERIPVEIKEMYLMVYGMAKFRHDQFPLHKDMIMYVMSYVTFNMYMAHEKKIKEFGARMRTYKKLPTSWQQEESCDLFAEHNAGTIKAFKCLDLASLDAGFSRSKTEESVTKEYLRQITNRNTGLNLTLNRRKKLVAHFIKRNIHPSLLKDPDVDYDDYDELEKMSRKRESKWRKHRDTTFRAKRQRKKL